eukprot:6872927-Alexandrium_andersonii.AAC.1
MTDTALNPAATAIANATHIQAFHHATTNTPPAHIHTAPTATTPINLDTPPPPTRRHPDRRTRTSPRRSTSAVRTGGAEDLPPVPPDEAGD